MNRLTKFVVTLIFIVVLVGGFYVLSDWISKTTGYTIRSDDSGIVGECLKSKEIIFYTSLNCIECSEQKKEFADALFGVNVVDCSQSPQECSVLSDIPAIEYKKGLYYNFKTLDEIRNIVEC